MARTKSAVLTDTKPSAAVKKAEKVKAAKAELKDLDKQLAKLTKQRDKVIAKLAKLEGVQVQVAQEAELEQQAQVQEQAA